MNELSGLIREYVRPVMKEAGFTNKGRVFRWEGECGDCLLMDFQAHAVDPLRYVFDVSFWIVPLVHWEFVNRQYTDLPEPDVSGALATYRVMPPPRFAYQVDPEGDFASRWAFEKLEARDACGEELAARLRSEELPRVMRLLDHKMLWKGVKGNPGGPLLRLRGYAQTEILLCIDDAPVGEVASMIDRAEKKGEFPSFVVWARRRLQQRCA